MNNYYHKQMIQLNMDRFHEDEDLANALEFLTKASVDTYKLYDEIANDIEDGLYRLSKRQRYVFYISKRVHEMIIDILFLTERISDQSLNGLTRIILEYTLTASVLANSKNRVSMKFGEWGILAEKKLIYEKYSILSENNEITEQIKSDYHKITNVYNEFKSRYPEKKIYSNTNGWTYFIDDKNPKIYNTKDLYKKFIPNLYFYILKSHNYVHSSSYAIDSDNYNLYCDGKIALKELLKSNFFLSAMSTHYISINLLKVFKKKKYRNLELQITKNIKNVLKFLN